MAVAVARHALTGDPEVDEYYVSHRFTVHTDTPTIPMPNTLLQCHVVIKSAAVVSMQLAFSASSACHLYAVVQRITRPEP